jgi:hypothetical protein
MSLSKRNDNIDIESTSYASTPKLTLILCIDAVLNGGLFDAAAGTRP